jgi:hypothetical protein
MSDVEAKAILLKELNNRRAREGRAPLATYPDVGCTSCGVLSPEGEKLFQSAVPYMRTCQKCVLGMYPFSRLRLPEEETIEWYRNNPTFHRSSDYGIVLTNRALYLYSPFWLMLSRWRRFPKNEIRDAKFCDSRLFPSLRVQLFNRTAVLRTPPDYADEMKFDRCNLIEAAERVRAVAQNEAHDA